MLNISDKQAPYSKLILKEDYKSPLTLVYPDVVEAPPLENVIPFPATIKQLTEQMIELEKENKTLKELVNKSKIVKENILEIQSSFIIKSSLCSLFLGATTISFIFSILGVIDWKPYIFFMWLVLSFGAWLTNYVNIESWKSKNVD